MEKTKEVNEKKQCDIHVVVGQSEQFNCFNVKFSDSPHRCMKQCDMCKPKNI